MVLAQGPCCTLRKVLCPQLVSGQSKGALGGVAPAGLVLILGSPWFFSTQKDQGKTDGVGNTFSNVDICFDTTCFRLTVQLKASKDKNLGTLDQ